jgi:hypothetical protein
VRLSFPERALASLAMDQIRPTPVSPRLIFSIKVFRANPKENDPDFGQSAQRIGTPTVIRSEISNRINTNR